MEITRFATSGALMTIVSIGLLQTLLAWGLNPILSLVFVYSSGASLGYVLNQRFTFRTTLPASKTAIPFFATYAVAIVLNAGIFTVLTDLANVMPQVAITISTIVAAGWTWFLLKNVVFGKNIRKQKVMDFQPEP